MLPRETVRMQQSRPTRLVSGRREKAQNGKRRCEAPGCETLLSRYNPSGTCNRHAGWRDDRKRRYD